MIRRTPSAFRRLKSAPAPKIPRASSTRPAISWAAITSDRARATPACPAATAMEPTITAPRKPEATAYPTARPVNSGFATTNEIKSANTPVVRPEIATNTRGPSVRWAAPVRLVWTATHTPASTARIRVDFTGTPWGSVVSTQGPGRDARRIIRGQRPFLRYVRWVYIWLFFSWIMLGQRREVNRGTDARRSKDHLPGARDVQVRDGGRRADNHRSLPHGEPPNPGRHEAGW